MSKPTGCRIRGGCLIAALATAGALTALPAVAADSRLDDANAHLVKAAALLNAAASAADAPAVGAHRERAIRLIEQAEGEIARAKQAADAPGLHMQPRANTPAPPRMR